jgi:hypothetical protein
MDDRQPADRGSFSFASPSPRFMLTCARCSNKHDGFGAKLWIKSTRLMMCAACAEQRANRRKERVAA